MEDEDEFGDCEHGPISARWSNWDFAIAAFQSLAGIFIAIAAFWEYLLSAAVAASNKEQLDGHFHQQAAMEMESIIAEIEEGE